MKTLLVTLLLCLAGLLSAVGIENPSLANPDGRNLPAKWTLYRSGTGDAGLERSAAGKFVLNDRSETGEVGIMQTVPVKPEDFGKKQGVRVRGKAFPERSAAGSYIQVIALPGNQLFQAPLLFNAENSSEVELPVELPAGTERLRITLYSHKQPTPAVEIEEIGWTEIRPLDIELGKRDYRLNTAIVKGGKPQAVILAPAKYAKLAESIRDASGVKLAIASDEWAHVPADPAIAVITLGNAADNRILERLYNLHYSLTDPTMPGKGGYELRSLHNPFADGRNFIIAGGSDDAGVKTAAARLAALLKSKRSGGELSLGHLADIKLSPDCRIPDEVYDVPFHEASPNYKLAGYFGWNILTKEMALFYLTNDPKYAEALKRLAFSADPASRAYLERGGELIENKAKPLASPYHYGSYLQILYWDLIEENPVFSDEDRARITREMFNQYLYFRNDRAAGFGMFGSCQTPQPGLPSRHGLWIANTFYVLSRYFDKYYPHPDFKKGAAVAENTYSSLFTGPVKLQGELGNHYWFSTSLDPIFVYLVLAEKTGKVPPENYRWLIDSLELLADGSEGDRILQYSADNLFSRAYYVTRDPRWLTLRRLTANHLYDGKFRIGQGFPVAPGAREGKLRTGDWMVDRPNPGEYAAWPDEFPDKAHAFRLAAYRTMPDAGGDRLLLDGFFEQGGRNAYHNFAVLQLRLGGSDLLGGYHTGFASYQDGMLAPETPRTSELLDASRTGNLLAVRGVVRQYNNSDWERTVLQDIGSHVLFIDRVTPTAAIGNWDVIFPFELFRGATLKANALGKAEIEQKGKSFTLANGRVMESDRKQFGGSAEGGSGLTIEFKTNLKGVPGATENFFTVLGPDADAMQIAPAAAVLKLGSDRALAVAGTFNAVTAGAAIIAPGRISGIGVKQIGDLFAATVPVRLDWRGDTLAINADAPGRATLAGGKTIDFKAGLNTFPGCPVPDPAALIPAASFERKAPVKAAKAALPELKKRWSDNLGSYLEPVTPIGDSLFAAAAGKKVVIFDLATGRKVREIDNGSQVKALCYWPERKLLLTGGIEDELVKAFTLEGALQWSFKSETALGLFQTGKTYWYRTQPGLAGVRQIATGKIGKGGENVCLVGSASTLEILNAEGKLQARLHILWGPLDQFFFIDENGEKSLYTGFSFNGTHPSPQILASPWRTGSTEKYLLPPKEIPMIYMWCQLRRGKLLEADVDNDGKVDVVGDTRGALNWITVWDKDGQYGKYHANFGAGPLPSMSNEPRLSLDQLMIRDFTAGDFDGDGKTEIAIALGRKLLLVFDGKLTRPEHFLSFDANPMKLAAAGRFLYLALEDGSILKIDGRSGQTVAAAKVAGVPVSLSLVAGQLIVCTNQGQISAFEL